MASGLLRRLPGPAIGPAPRRTVQLGSIGYYGFLATRVAPQRLLATAARRALRVARRGFVTPPAAPEPGRVLAAFGCEDARALAAHLAARPRPARPAWTPGALRSALERHLPGEVDRVLARAGDAAAGRLAVFGRACDVRRADGGTDWQLDPHRGARFSGTAPSAELPPAPGLDRKMAWAIGRGEQWVALAQGAVLDARGGDAHAAALAASVADFVAANPVGRGVQWTCAMEAALRGVNLALAIHLLLARPAPLPAGLALDAVRLAIASGRFVLAHLEDDTAVPNNHLAADWLGLLALSAFVPGWPEAGRWGALATAGLRRALDEQVHPDGTTFEGSVPYHRLALEIFATGLLAAHAAGRGLGGAYAARLGAMFRAARALLSTSGALPQLGDNDSGRVLALRERGGLEGGYLLPLGAALLGDASLLAGDVAGDAAEVAWLLGPDALARVARPRAVAPARTGASFRDGGFHALRRGGVEAFVSCGANGQRGLGGHSHNDKLALELRVGGRLVVCDPGSPSYTGDPGLRNAFRGTRAHATVTVDGLEQAPLPADRLFALPEAAGARVLAFEADVAAERLVGEHRGFARAGVVHLREVVVRAEGAVAVDRLLGAGPHAVELRWPFAVTAVAARAATPEEAARLDALAAAAHLPDRLDAGRVLEVTLDGGARVLVAFRLPGGLSSSVAPSSWSPGYGELHDGVCAIAAGETTLPAALSTAFLPLPPPTKGTDS